MYHVVDVVGSMVDAMVDAMVGAMVDATNPVGAKNFSPLRMVSPPIRMENR